MDGHKSHLDNAAFLLHLTNIMASTHALKDVVPENGMACYKCADSKKYSFNIKIPEKEHLIVSYVEHTN
jgi:hypothetical protein